MDNVYTVASSSSSTTYGNVMMSFKEALTNLFDPDTFNDVYVSSEIAYVNMRRRRGRNTKDEMAKLRKPYMVIQPQIQPPNSDLYLYDIPLTKNIDNLEYGLFTNTLLPILANLDDGYALSYKLNRDQLSFDIRIKVETFIQQIDLFNNMKNWLRWDHPFSVRTSLEAMIPRHIVSQMSKLSNIWIDDKETNQIPAALRMLNEISRFPITYKMRNGTALDEFFMYYTPELIITLTDLTPEQGNMRGMISDYYEITFRATVDFNLPGMFVLTGMKPKPEMIDISLAVKDKDNTYDFIPLYTIHDMYAKYQNCKNGYILYASSRFQTEADPKSKSDNFDFSVLFDPGYMNVLQEYNIKNIPITTLVSVTLLKDGDLLSEGKDYSIDWMKIQVIIPDADNKATYHIFIYINNRLFNEELIDTETEGRFDKPNI